MIIIFLAKLLRSLATFVVVTFVTFAIMYSDAVGIARGTLSMQASEDDVAAQLIRLGLDRPLLVQYGDWLAGVFTGDLGRSFYTSESVVSALSNRVPVTLTLIIVTLLLTVVISVVLGVTAAVRGGWIDRIVQFFSVLGTAIPAFVVAIALMFTFAIFLRVLPATGYVRPEQSFDLWAKSLVLPVLALLIGSVASAAQQFRTAVLDTLSRDYVRTLRARGVRGREVIFRNVLRNSAAPGLTVLSLQTFSLLGGAVFIETVFALGGMGQLATTSAQIQDVPMVMGTVLVTIVIVLVVNFTGDLLISLLNPKARTR